MEFSYAVTRHGTSEEISIVTDKTLQARVRTDPDFHRGFESSTARATEAKCDSTPWGRSTLPQVALAVPLTARSGQNVVVFFQYESCSLNGVISMSHDPRH